MDQHFDRVLTSYQLNESLMKSRSRRALKSTVNSFLNLSRLGDSMKVFAVTIRTVIWRTTLKGVVLAGGLGTRLRPLTSVTNKHLLPVYNQPMIYYPIQTLVNAGISDIMVVTGGSSAGEFLRLLGNGKEFGLKHLNYTYQEGEGGIAEALSLVEHFAAGEPVCVVLGDNIIEGNIRAAVDAYRRQGSGAKIMLKQVPDPQRFGVPKLDGRRVVTSKRSPRCRSRTTR